MNPIEHIKSKIGTSTHPEGIGMQAGNLAAHYDASGLKQDAQDIYEYARSLIPPDRTASFKRGYESGYNLYPLSLGDTEVPS